MNRRDNINVDNYLEEGIPKWIVIAQSGTVKKRTRKILNPYYKVS